MKVFILECWSNQWAGWIDGEQTKSTTIAFVGSSLEECYKFASANRSFAGRDSPPWHWCAMETPLDVDTWNTVGGWNEQVYHHFTQDLKPCDHNGVCDPCRNCHEDCKTFNCTCGDEDVEEDEEFEENEDEDTQDEFIDEDTEEANLEKEKWNDPDDWEKAGVRTVALEDIEMAEEMRTLEKIETLLKDDQYIRRKVDKFESQLLRLQDVLTDLIQEMSYDKNR